jgi:LPXTG-motif cell wall-anchored protein
MPTPRRPDPEPLETDDVRVIVIGTVLWAVALVLTLVWHDRLADTGHGDWVWVTLAGTFLGLLGLPYLLRRRRLLRQNGDT